nr:MAG TPA: hypothetical protein [Bacteriophage sp.]
MFTLEPTSVLLALWYRYSPIFIYQCTIYKCAVFNTPLPS